MNNIQEYKTGATYGVNLEGLTDEQLQEKIEAFIKRLESEGGKDLYYYEILETLNDCDRDVVNLLFANFTDFDNILSFFSEPLVGGLDSELFKVRLLLNARVYGVKNMYSYDVFTTNIELVCSDSTKSNELASESFANELVNDLIDEFYYYPDQYLQFETIDEDTGEYVLDVDTWLEANDINPYRFDGENVSDRVINDFERQKDGFYINYNGEIYYSDNV